MQGNGRRESHPVQSLGPRPHRHGLVRQIPGRRPGELRTERRRDTKEPGRNRRTVTKTQATSNGLQAKMGLDSP